MVIVGTLILWFTLAIKESPGKISLNLAARRLIKQEFPRSGLSQPLVFDDADLSSHGADALDDFLLHEVEAHGDDGHPDEDVH